MRLVLGLKIAQHAKLAHQLIATGDDEIVEDCTKRPRGSGLFWGAASKEGKWIGQNWLGCLWMNLRDSLSNERMDLATVVSQA